MTTRITDELIERRAALSDWVPLPPEVAPIGRTTGWPPGMLQDDSRELSKALASKPDARMHVRDVAAEIAGSTAPAVPASPLLTDAVRDVLAERERQIEKEGWTPDHDDEHAGGGMAFAAAAYAVSSAECSFFITSLWDWTGWATKWFKPKNPRTDLIRAGALILAEIERLDRAAVRAKFSGDQP